MHSRSMQKPYITVPSGTRRSVSSVWSRCIKCIRCSFWRTSTTSNTYVWGRSCRNWSSSSISVRSNRLKGLRLILQRCVMIRITRKSQRSHRFPSRTSRTHCFLSGFLSRFKSSPDWLIEWYHLISSLSNSHLGILNYYWSWSLKSKSWNHTLALTPSLSTWEISSLSSRNQNCPSRRFIKGIGSYSKKW